MQTIFGSLDELRRTAIQSGIRDGADSGKPETGYSELYDDGETEAGLWTCTPGGWPIENRPDTEVVLILSGRARISEVDGDSREVGPGDFFVLPKGWSGRWDVIEPVEKLYVINTGEMS